MSNRQYNQKILYKIHLGQNSPERRQRARRISNYNLFIIYLKISKFVYILEILCDNEIKIKLFKLSSSRPNIGFQAPRIFILLLQVYLHPGFWIRVGFILTFQKKTRIRATFE